MNAPDHANPWFLLALGFIGAAAFIVGFVPLQWLKGSYFGVGELLGGAMYTGVSFALLAWLRGKAKSRPSGRGGGRRRRGRRDRGPKDNSVL